MLMSRSQKYFGLVPGFDPPQGSTVRDPQEQEYGYWVGAPSVTYDPVTALFYLAYRIRVRKDRGRGIACGLAESRDGVSFTDIAQVTRESLDSASIEKSALFQVGPTQYRLYISYVDSSTNQWRIDMMEADSPHHVNAATRVKILTGEDVGTEGIKDPTVFRIGATTYLFAQCLPNREKVDPRTLHATEDGFAIGLTRVESRVFRSTDGVHFTPTGGVLTPSETGWDSLSRRVTTVIPAHHGYLVCYDGKRTPAESYEEQCGLAWTSDFRNFEIISAEAPQYSSPYASGALRYVDAIWVGQRLYYYYEMAEPSQAHSLKVAIVEG